MLIIDAREAESIDKALKNYKKKFEKAGILRELRSRQSFMKPSIKRRATVLRAEYKQQMTSDQE
ncbi:MAG: 30S ribosomal protein S21 [Fimbriimonadaceae bacterium]|nr:30S ribosomal protein S21 [Chitinophagales bacterium]